MKTFGKSKMEILQKIFVLEKFWCTFEKIFKKFQKPFIQYMNNSNCKAYLKQLRKTSRKKTKENIRKVQNYSGEI